MKFKVLGGKHTETAQEGKVATIYHRGDIVEANHDLCRMFNKPKSLKFLRVPDNTPNKRTLPSLPPKVEDDPEDILNARDDLESTGEETLSEESELQDSFSDLKKAELISLAEENEIDLGDATLKADILRVVRQHVGG